MEADRPAIRPAVPEQAGRAERHEPAAHGIPAAKDGSTAGPPEVFRSDGRRASRRDPLFVADSVALVAVPLALLGWLGVACGAGLLFSARNAPEGLTGLAVYFWLAAVGPVAVLSTAVAAVALYRRRSRRLAALFAVLELVGLWALTLLGSVR